MHPKLVPEIKLGFQDVLIVPRPSQRGEVIGSRKDVDLLSRLSFLHGKVAFAGVPIIAANMIGVGTTAMAKAFAEVGQGATVALHKHYKIDDLISFYDQNGGANAWYSMGMRDKDLAQFETFMASSPQQEGRGIAKLCLDAANGNLRPFWDLVARMRDRLPDALIMAGNVAVPEAVEGILKAGADVVKIGIGPGSVCRTRAMTGVGYPQVSAVLECGDAAHTMGGHICSDGGCREIGDIAKAIVAGADFVMVGGMFAAHEQAEQPVITDHTGRFVEFYGSSSAHAMNNHHGGMADHRASEGALVLAPCKGDVRVTLSEIFGALRSSCTLAGVMSIDALRTDAKLVRVSAQHTPMFSQVLGH